MWGRWVGRSSLTRGVAGPEIAVHRTRREGERAHLARTEPAGLDAGRADTPPRRDGDDDLPLGAWQHASPLPRPHGPGRSLRPASRLVRGSRGAAASLGGRWLGRDTDCSRPRGVFLRPPVTLGASALRALLLAAVILVASARSCGGRSCGGDLTKVHRR